MDFLLNEKSLHGQFYEENQFLESLKPVIKSIDLIQRSSNIQIWKITNFHECKVIKDKTICSLNLNRASDELLRFKIILDNVLKREPYWDSEPMHDISQKFMWKGEDVAATSLAEAAIKGDTLLSFDSEKFKDCVLQIENEKNIYEVCSVYSPKYLPTQNYSSVKIR